MALTRQHAETDVVELIGKTCEQLLAVPGSVNDEVVALYLLASGIWYRMFVDAGLLFLDEASPDPEDDLDDDAAYIDLTAKLGCGGDAIEELSMSGGTARLRFRAGVTCVLRETGGRVRLSSGHE